MKSDGQIEIKLNSSHEQHPAFIDSIPKTVVAVAHKGHCTTEKQKSDYAWCWSLTSTAKHTACASNARLIMAAMMALAHTAGRLP